MDLPAQLGVSSAGHLNYLRYPFLVVDARYEDVRVDGRIVSQGVLGRGPLRK
jgi:transposase-like protein